jgi:hypothetical protein
VRWVHVRRVGGVIPSGHHPRHEDRAPAAVAGLNEEPGRGIIVGSSMLRHTLNAPDFIEVYQLWMHPVVLGGGKAALRCGWNLPPRSDRRRSGDRRRLGDRDLRSTTSAATRCDDERRRAAAVTLRREHPDPLIPLARRVPCAGAKQADQSFRAVRVIPIPIWALAAGSLWNRFGSLVMPYSPSMRAVTGGGSRHAPAVASLGSVSDDTGTMHACAAAGGCEYEAWPTTAREVRRDALRFPRQSGTSVPIAGSTRDQGHSPGARPACAALTPGQPRSPDVC